MLRRVLFVTSLVSTLVLPPQIHAETGVQPGKIIFGQSAGLTGPNARIAKEFNDGIQAYFSYQNDLGGVNGRKLELVTKDDGSIPEKTATNVDELATKDNVFGLVGVFGTANNQAINDYIQKNKIPSIAPYTGSDGTRIYFNPWLFNMRASYRDEAERIIRQLTSLGMKRIGVLYQDDSFGKDGLEGVQRTLRKNDLDPVATAGYDRAKGDVSAAVKALAPANLNAVVLVAASKPAADFVRQMKRQGQMLQYFALSQVDANELYTLLGDDAIGVAISQVVPNPTTGQESIVAEYQKAMKQHKAALSYASMEGFLAGKVVVEGLKKAGANPTRQNFVQALEALDDRSFGGFPLHYQPTNHRGSNYVDFVVIGKGGRLGH